MPSLKLWSSETGSAVAEFVMVVVPSTALLLSLTGIFGLMHARVIDGQLAYEIARYSALADLNLSEKQDYLNGISPGAKLLIERDSGCSAVVTIVRKVRIFPIPSDIQVQSVGQAQCEDI